MWELSQKHKLCIRDEHSASDDGGSSSSSAQTARCQRPRSRRSANTQLEFDQPTTSHNLLIVPDLEYVQFCCGRVCHLHAKSRRMEVSARRGLFNRFSEDDGFGVETRSFFVHWSSNGQADTCKGQAYTVRGHCPFNVGGTYLGAAIKGEVANWQ